MTRTTRFCLLLALLSCSFLFAQTPALDSMRQVVSTQTGAQRIVTWQELAFQCLRYNTDSSQVFAQKSLEAAKRAGLDSLAAEAYKYLGMCAFLTSDQETAISRYQQAIALHERLGNGASAAAALANLGSAYNRIGDYEAALEAELRAQSYFEAHADTVRLFLIMGNIAELYGNIEAPRKSLEYAKRSFVLNKVYSRGPLTATPSSNLANSYLDMANLDNIYLDTALYYYRLARDEFSRTQDPFNQSVIYNNLGYVFELRTELDSAWEAYKHAYQLNRALNRPASASKALSNMAELRIEQGQLQEAAQHLDSAWHYMSLSDETGVYQRVYHAVYQLAEAENQPAKALAWYKKSEALRDTLLNRERVQSLAELQTRYETEKKDRQIAEQEVKLSEAARQQEQLIYGSLIGLLALLVVAGLVFYRYRLQQQARLNAERLEQQQLRIRATLQAQEEERGRFARDLHDSVGQVLAATRLQFGAFDSPTQDPAYGQALDTLDDACREVRAIAHTMMPRSLEEQGLDAAACELIEKAVLPAGIHAEVDVLGTSQPLSPEKQIAVYRILQELIQNVIKHAEATAVHIQLMYRAEQLILRVEDNGKGLPANLSRSGAGMNNINLRAEAVSAHFDLENGPDGRGTIATLRLSTAGPT